MAAERIATLAIGATAANITTRGCAGLTRREPSDEDSNAGVKTMRLIGLAAAGMAAGAIALSAVATAPASAASESQRVTVTGEVIDSWCYLSEIMWAEGSAHHRCAVWCARGGVPVGILGEDEEVYILLMMENDSNVIGNKAVFRIQTKEVVVTGDLYERDSVKYLAVNEIVEDHGIVNYSHEDFDVQPGGL